MAIHVYPIDDFKDHLLESTCDCNPAVTIQNGEMIICHNSFDGREIIEEVNEILNTKINNNGRPKK